MITTCGGSPSVLKTTAPGVVATIAAARHLAQISDETSRAFPKTNLPSASKRNGIAPNLVMADFLSSQFVFLSQGWDRYPAAARKLEAFVDHDDARRLRAPVPPR